METTVFLVRHGVTEWHAQRRLLGQRDVPLSPEGEAQAKAVAQALFGANLPVGEIISSPLLRATQSAEIIAEAFKLNIAKDPRLTDFRLGRWEGMSYAEVSASPEYQKFMANPMSDAIPGGEHLTEIRDRAVGAVEQNIRDTPAGESLMLVTHAGIVRVILAHYLGSQLVNYHRIRVAPGSVSVLSFADDRELPRILAVNWHLNLSDV